MEGEDGQLVKEVFGKGTMNGKLGNTECPSNKTEKVPQVYIGNESDMNI